MARSHTHTHTHTPRVTWTYTHTHIHTHSVGPPEPGVDLEKEQITHACTHTQCHTHTHTLCHTHAHTPCHTRITHTHTPCHTPTHTHTHLCTHTHTHTHTPEPGVTLEYGEVGVEDGVRGALVRRRGVLGVREGRTSRSAKNKQEALVGDVSRDRNGVSLVVFFSK